MPIAIRICSLYTNTHEAHTYKRPEALQAIFNLLYKPIDRDLLRYAVFVLSTHENTLLSTNNRVVWNTHDIKYVRHVRNYFRVHTPTIAFGLMEVMNVVNVTLLVENLS